MKKKNLFRVMLLIFAIIVNFSNVFACGTQIGIRNITSSLIDIKTDDRYAYVSSGRYLKIVDLLDETNPVVVSTIQVPYESWFYQTYAGALDVVGDYVYLTDKDGYLHSIDVSDREHPVIKDSLQVGQDNYDHGKDIQIVGSYAYTVYRMSGLLVVDISDPENLSVAGSFSQSDPYSVAVDGNHVYIGCTGIRIVDMSDMENPVDEGLFNGPSGLGFVYKMSLDWPYLYIANGDFGVVDVTNPVNPALIGHYNTYGITIDVDISGNGIFAYLSNGNSYGGNAEVLNIFNPENPVQLCSMSMDNDIYGTALKGDRAVIGSGSDLQLVGFDLVPVFEEVFSPQSVITGGAFDSNRKNLYPFTLSESASIAILSGGALDVKARLLTLENSVVLDENGSEYASGYTDIGSCVCSNGGLSQTPGGHAQANFMYRKQDLIAGDYVLEVTPEDAQTSIDGVYSVVFLKKASTSDEFFEGMEMLLSDEDTTNDHLDIYVKALYPTIYNTADTITVSNNYGNSICYSGVCRERQCKALINFFLYEILGINYLRGDTEIQSTYWTMFDDVDENCVADNDYMMQAEEGTLLYHSTSSFGSPPCDSGDYFYNPIADEVLRSDSGNLWDYVSRGDIFADNVNSHYGLIHDEDKIIDSNWASPMDGRLRFGNELGARDSDNWKIVRP
jgi:hypothetical protein